MHIWYHILTTVNIYWIISLKLPWEIAWDFLIFSLFSLKAVVGMMMGASDHDRPGGQKQPCDWLSDQPARYAEQLHCLRQQYNNLPLAWKIVFLTCIDGKCSILVVNFRNQQVLVLLVTTCTSWIVLEDRRSPPGKNCPEQSSLVFLTLQFDGRSCPIPSY